MAKVGASVGFKMNLGNYQSADYTLWVTDIDASGDIEAQLAEAAPGLARTAEWLEQQLATKLEDNDLIKRVTTRPMIK